MVSVKHPLKNIDIPCQKIIDHPGYPIDFRIIDFSHENDLFVSYPKLEYFYQNETHTVPIMTKIDKWVGWDKLYSQMH